MLPSYFDYIFVHLTQKIRLRPKLNPKFLSTLGPNLVQTRTRPKKPGPTNNSAAVRLAFIGLLIFCGKKSLFKLTYTTVVSSQKRLKLSSNVFNSFKNDVTNKGADKIQDSLVFVHFSFVASPLKKTMSIKTVLFNRVRIWTNKYDLRQTSTRAVLTNHYTSLTRAN